MPDASPKLVLLVAAALAIGALPPGSAHAAGDPGKKAAAKIARQQPDADRINAATFQAGGPDRAFLVRVQVLLDKARFHPGVVDGIPGENLDNAIRAFKRARGLPDDAALDEATWNALKADDAPPLAEYVVSAKDAKGPFTRSIPSKMELQAELPRLGYRDAWEALAERFHTTPAFLHALNRGKDASRAGTKLRVPNIDRSWDPTDPKAAARDIRRVAKEADRPKAAQIVVDKPARLLTAFGPEGKVLATYPASIGSSDKPAPSGTHKLVRVAPDPGYTYNPKYAFKGVKAKQAFEIKPGPNNPVGVVWIELEGDGYGIHGTPEPDRVGKTNSHGCVRLTNWNALELASLVSEGVPVEFRDGEATAPGPVSAR